MASAFSPLQRATADPVRRAANVPPAIAAEYDGWYELVTLRADSMIARPLLLSHLKVGENGLLWRLLGAKWWFTAVTETTFRMQDAPLPTVALITNDGARLLQFSRMPGQTFRRIATSWAWAQVVVLHLALILSITTVLHACVWLPRWPMGRIKGAAQIGLRALPLLAALSLVALTLVYKVAASDLEAVMRLGMPSTWSLTILVLTLAFPLFAVAAFVQTLRLGRSEATRVVWWPAFATSLVMIVIATYLAMGGAVGLRTWA